LGANDKPKQLKPKEDAFPHPLSQVPRRRRQQQIHAVPNEPFEEAPQQPILMLEVADHRFNRRPPSKPRSQPFRGAEGRMTKVMMICWRSSEAVPRLGYQQKNR
jgi:hypothetical protein